MSTILKSYELELEVTGKVRIFVEANTKLDAHKQAKKQVGRERVCVISSISSSEIIGEL